MARRVLSLWLLIVAILIPHGAAAQWGRRFTIAAGPSIGIKDTPPNAGVHLRTSAALAPGPRALNLLADVYLSWLAPGTDEFAITGGTFAVRDRETQVGLGLSGVLSFRRDRSVSPYVLVGGVYRWSDADRRLTIRDDTGQVTDRLDIHQNDDQLDILLGLGTAFRWGTRRVLLEGRLYGGTAVFLPITVGLTL